MRTAKAQRVQMFLGIAKAYREVDPIADPTAFIALSVRVHAAKASVPRALWRLARRPDVERKGTWTPAGIAR
jgi:hypothetical protein